MAFFTSTEIKEPLVEAQTKQAIARRGAESVGLLLLVAGGLVALLFGSFTPSDPSFFHATDAPPANFLGVPGAMAADLLHRSLGWGAWGIPIIFGTWGLRFLFHYGEGRLVRRMILVPFAIGLASVFASAHAPVNGWPHDYGLGGWFGDAVLGGLLSAIPTNIGLSLVTVTLALLAGLLTLSVIAMGATWREVRFCLLYTSPSPREQRGSRMPSSA